jgi:Cd2+/Zn2+-exporting ATPase
VSAVVDGHEARLGSLRHTEELIPVCLRARVRELLELVQHRGQIAVVIAHAEQAAVLILADAVRPGAECLTERLHEIGVAPVVMLTGDNALTAGRVAGALGLDEFHAELLPPDKVAHVERLKQRGGGRRRVVGVIGDGVNDAPALAAADVSLAIGSIGSDAALESADIVLLSDDLLSVPRAVQLARRATRTIAINLAFALGAMVIMAVVTLAASSGLLGAQWQVPLWLGVLGHEGGTLLVVANSLLLLGGRYEANCTCERGPGRGHDHAHTHHEHEVAGARAGGGGEAATG